MVARCWFDRPYELRSFMVLIFTDARQNPRWVRREGKERVNGGGRVMWYSNSESVSVPGGRRAEDSETVGKVEEDTDVGVWEKAEEEAKRDRFAASVEVYTENIPRRVMLAWSSGTARGRHKFRDRTWRHAAKDFCEDRLSICDAFLENSYILQRVIKILNDLVASSLSIIEFILIFNLLIVYLN